MARLKTSTFFVGFLVFILGLIFMFPLQNLRGYVFDKIYKQTGILIVAENIHPLFLGWPGVGIEKVNVTLPAGDNDIELTSERLDFRVRLTGMFVPAVSLFLKELKQGGSLFIRAGQRNPKTYFTLQADDLNLEQINIPGLNQGIIGHLESDIDVVFDSSDNTKSKGSVSMDGKALKTPSYLVNNPMMGPAFQIPAMDIGLLDVKMRINNGVLEIQNFKLGGPDSELSGTVAGEFRLGKTYPETFVNVTLKLKFSSKILDNPQNKTFLDFLGAYKTAVPGEFGMRWNASVAEIMGLMKALPEPIR